jgi:hypothetical protein
VLRDFFGGDQDAAVRAENFLPGFFYFPFAFHPMLNIIPEQTLNRDGMVTSVEFSWRGLF